VTDTDRRRTRKMRGREIEIKANFVNLSRPIGALCPFLLGIVGWVRMKKA
jgi:hypothetical protein